MSADRHVLVLGGRRSGKSRWAETLAVGTGGRPPIYVATAEGRDAEMAERIAAHRTRRGSAFETIEEPLLLPAAVKRAAVADRVVLVDCLTLWLANIMEADRDVAAEAAALVAVLQAAAGPVVLVANEVGSGIVPENALARRFADAQGILNRQVAEVVGRVVLVVAGIAVPIKPAPTPEMTL